jgi:hypothetical protein
MFWKHHCSSCEYVTSFELSHRYGDKWDIYFHKYENNFEFVARFGDEPENYIADDNISNYDVNHPLGYYLTTSLSDFTASIRLLSTEEGGRRTPVISGYRPSLRFQFDNYLTTGYHIFNKQTVNPGESETADIKIISKDYFAGKLKEGMMFDIFEGNHKVGEGIIITIINKLLLF